MLRVLSLLALFVATDAFGIAITHRTKKPGTDTLKAKIKCVNQKHWKSKYNYTCGNYVKDKYCTRSGAQGTGWDPKWGKFEDNADPKTNINASTACCACGGGTNITRIYQNRNTILNQTCK